MSGDLGVVDRLDAGVESSVGDGGGGLGDLGEWVEQTPRRPHPDAGPDQNHQGRAGEEDDAEASQRVLDLSEGNDLEVGDVGELGDAGRAESQPQREVWFAPDAVVHHGCLVGVGHLVDQGPGQIARVEGASVPAVVGADDGSAAAEAGERAEEHGEVRVGGAQGRLYLARVGEELLARRVLALAQHGLAGQPVGDDHEQGGGE
jgi:hypothetical protein